jgi:hypothetical protein
VISTDLLAPQVNCELTALCTPRVTNTAARPWRPASPDSRNATLVASPSIQQLTEGQTYHVNGWTITVSGWVRFTNDATGRGIAGAAQNHDFF